MLGALVGLVVRQFRSRTSLTAENELLRQQLAAAKSRLQRKRVMFTGSQLLDDRAPDEMHGFVADDGDAGAAGHCASVAPRGLPPSVAMVVVCQNSIVTVDE